MRQLGMPTAVTLVLFSICSVTSGAETCAVCPPQDRCVFRVLAVGDSLTRGAVPTKGSSHPYSIKMSEVLSNRLGSRSTNKANVQVTTAGENDTSFVNWSMPAIIK